MKLDNNPAKENFYNKVKMLVFLVLAGIPLVFTPVGENADHFYFPKVVVMFVIVVSYLVLLILNIRKKGKIIDRDRINKFLLLYLALLIISVFFSGNKALSIWGSVLRREGLITIMMYICIFLIARSSPKLDDKFFTSVLMTGIIVSVYGILQYFRLDPFLRDVIRTNWGTRPFSTMGNPNFLGSYLVLIIPLSVYLYVIKGRKTGLAGFGIMFFSLLSTSTRGAWLGAMASAICFAFLHYKYYKISKKEFNRYIKIFILAVIIILIFNIQTEGKLLSRFLSIQEQAKSFLTNSETADKAGSGRGFIWKRTIELIGRKPIFGFGIENLGSAFEHYYTPDMMDYWGRIMNVDKAHNEYLQIAVSSGIPSLAAYLIYLYLILKKGMKSFSKDNSKLFLTSSILGYMTTAFFNISVVSVAYIFWTYLGLMCQE